MIDERSPDARLRDARLYAHEVRQIVSATTETLAGRDKVPNEVLAGEPEIPWRSIIGLRHRLVHAYWLIDPGIISEIAQNETAPLIAALDRLIAGIKR
jgi:uncharacterized protein with HEPN domain